MKRFQSAICATTLTLLISSAALAGDIGTPFAARAGDIGTPSASKAPGDIGTPFALLSLGDIGTPFFRALLSFISIG